VWGNRRNAPALTAAFLLRQQCTLYSIQIENATHDLGFQRFAAKKEGQRVSRNFFPHLTAPDYGLTWWGGEKSA